MLWHIYPHIIFVFFNIRFSILIHTHFYILSVFERYSTLLYVDYVHPCTQNHLSTIYIYGLQHGDVYTFWTQEVKNKSHDLVMKSIFLKYCIDTKSESVYKSLIKISVFKLYIFLSFNPYFNIRETDYDRTVYFIRDIMYT